MKLNILFVNLPSLPLNKLDDSFTGKNIMYAPASLPLGILYLSSYIKKYNQLSKVGILDYVINIKNLLCYKNTDDFIEGLINKEIDFKPDIIAFSLMFSTSYPFFCKCLEKLKSKFPESKVIIGGAYATGFYIQLLKNKEIDYVIRGEGEMAFSEFIKQVSNNQEIKIKGVYSKDSDFNNLEIGDFVYDLDSIPFPDWDLIKINEYIQEKGRRKNINQAEKAKIASIVTTRGCPFLCTFCASHLVHGRRLRFRSIENIVQEIKLLYEKYGVTLFIPEDDLFTAVEERILKLLEEISKLNIPGLQFQFTNALSVSTLSEKVIDSLIKNVKMDIVYLAIESGSEYTQRNIIKKNVNLKKAIDMTKYLRAKGVFVKCYFILGFPNETKEMMNETIEYIKKQKPDWVSFCVATPLFGSEMFDEFVKLGYIKEDDHNCTFLERKFDTKEITAKELNELIYKSNIEYNFINNQNLQEGNYKRALILFNDIISVYPFHIICWYCIMECYKKMNDPEKTKEIEKKINELILTNKRSYDLYYKFKHLMPNINICKEIKNKMAQEKQTESNFYY